MRYDGRTIYASDALVQAAHKAGIKVGVWIVSDETAMAKMPDLGSMR